MVFSASTSTCPADRPTGQPASDRHTELAGAVRTSPAPPRRAKPLGSARLRILGWSIFLLAAALAATAEVTHVLLVRQLDQAVHADLTGEINEFRALALTGPAASAAPAGHLAAVLRTGAGRTVSQPDTVLLGLINGRVVAISASSAAPAVTASRPLLAHWAAVSGLVYGSANLGAGQIRYAALPVHAAGDPAHGVFVTATLMAGQQQAVDRASQLQLEVGAAALAIASVLAWIVSGRVLRPIRDTTELARRITETDLSERIPVRGHDEVSELSRTINGMLGRLESTFAAQRQFLADAGHELRTPITIIHGNLDTLRPADPEDAETLAIVSDELTRMNRLTEELLLLAGSERPGFLRPRPVDLARLTAALAVKARALDSRPWLATGSANGTAVLDPERITQAVMQLAANAATHTRPGLPVELSSRIEQDSIVFSVADRGSGVPAADRERVFQRFARLDSPRRDGTGLGLSIVAAIAAAHGGSATVHDNPRGGAIFRLAIPFRQSGALPVPADPGVPA